MTGTPPGLRTKCWSLGGAFLLIAFSLTGFRQLPEGLPPFVHKTHEVLNALTGAGGSFGFFSPDIGPQLVVKFDVRKGETWHRGISLEEFLPHEVAIRLGNMNRFLGQTYQDERLRRSVAASLATRVFARFPAADEVTLIASAHQIPMLAEYADGRRFQVDEVYRVRFKRGSRESEEP
ncbi:MAG: hypothetical protein KF802_01730 [Bdellovibrionaceae bacterium]|nr:hypothetical protein [Pseudobdellovibrionaceae bacterium]